MNMIRTFAASLAATVALAAVPAAAQETQDRDRLIDWGYTLAGNVEADQGLMRLRDPLCLLVAADDQAFGAKVARRVVDNAKAIGIPVKRGKCRHNALIVVTDNAQSRLQKMNAERGLVYGSLYAAQLDRILARETAGFAFQVHQFDNAGWSGLFSRLAPMRVDPGAVDMVGTLVVIDRAAAEGLDPVQLGDYAALRLLAPTSDTFELRDRGEGTPPTILTLFRDRENAPRQMTAFDRAYLQSLYRLPPGSFARSIMAHASRIALAEVPAARGQ
jgi:hypothetical protein